MRGRLPGPPLLMIQVATQIFRFRALLWTLTARELTARYRGSALGYLWSLGNPLLLLGVYTFVFSVVFRPRVAGADPYALFVVSGLFPWIWLSTSLLEGAVSLTANSGLLRKAVFPIELLPSVAVLSNLFHLLFATPVLAGAILVGRYFGHPVGGWATLLAPLVILLEVPLITGLALGLSALNVHFKDVRDLLTNLLALAFFLTPILYRIEALDGLPRVQAAIRANPFAPFALAYQRTIFEGRVPELSLWLQMGLVSGVAWIAGAWLFDRLRETLVEAA